MENVFRAIGGSMNKIVDSLYLGLLWLLCSIPVFTIGASTTALYYAMQKNILHDHSYPGKVFFYCFKKSFRQATVLWLGILFFALAMLFGAYQASNDAIPGFFLYIYVILFIVLAALTLHAFPYLARFEGSNPEIIRNCLIIAAANPAQTFLALLLTVTAVLIVWLFPPAILLVPAPFILLLGKLMEKTFGKYLSEEEKHAEFERNRKWKN